MHVTATVHVTVHVHVTATVHVTVHVNVHMTVHVNVHMTVSVHMTVQHPERTGERGTGVLNSSGKMPSEIRI